jgi:hypothetical protein
MLKLPTHSGFHDLFLKYYINKVNYVNIKKTGIKCQIHKCNCLFEVAMCLKFEIKLQHFSLSVWIFSLIKNMLSKCKEKKYHTVGTLEIH